MFKKLIGIKDKIAVDEASVKASIDRDGYIDPGVTQGQNVWRNRSKYLESEDYRSDLAYFAYYLVLLKNGNMYDVIKDSLLATPQVKVNFNQPIGGLAVFSMAAKLNPANWGFSIANAAEAANVLSKSKEELINILGESTASGVATYRLKCDEYIWNAANGDYDVSGETIDLIASLGEFFKKSAYVYTTETNENGEEEITGWRASQVSVTGALIYAIFIFQSLLYLVSYVRRVFYVIMLAMFGPIVVVYDFFMKSAG